MDQLTYLNHLDNYINLQREKLNMLETVRHCDFKEKDLHCIDISASLLSAWEEHFKFEGIAGKVPVLYYFEVIFPTDQQAIQTAVKLLKAPPGKSDRALPRINKLPSGIKSNIIYVGKTSNFYSRLQQHFGFGNRRTYALHLDQWAPQLNLHLRLHYMAFDFDGDHISMLEEVENVFHHALKPMLGRQGR